MDLRSFSKSIEQAFELAGDMGLEPLPSQLFSLDTDETARALASAATDYGAYYSYCLDRSHYNFRTIDGDLFQFQGVFRRRMDYELRLAYLPSIFARNAADDMIDEHDAAAGVEASVQNVGAPMVRFEYSQAQYVALRHPCAHLHLGFRNPGRLMFRKILTPLAFTQFLLRHLKPTEWYRFADNDKSFGGYVFERASALESRGLDRVVAEYLSDEEEQLIHLSVR